MTVYMVTSGIYSDYEVRGIFSTRAKAEAFCDGRSECDWFDVELDEPFSCLVGGIEWLTSGESK